MAKYRIQAPDGQTYEIEGPEGATDDQVRAEVLRQHPAAAAAASAQAQSYDGGSDMAPPANDTVPAGPVTGGAPGQPQPASQPGGQDTLAPLTDVVSFGDGAGADSARPNLSMTPDQEQHLRSILANGVGSPDEIAEQAIQYVKSTGYPLNAESARPAYRSLVENRKTKPIGGILYPKAQPLDTGGNESADAGVMGVLSDIPGINKIEAAANTTEKWLRGNLNESFGNGYNRQLDRIEATNEQAQGDHPWMYGGGQLAGLLAIPTNAPAVASRAGLEAGTAALRAGETMLDARKAAQKAYRITSGNRQALEMGAYGASQGLNEDNLPDALTTGLTDAVTGLVGGKVFGDLASRAGSLAPHVRSVVNTIENTGDRLAASVTRRGAYDIASNTLGTAATGSPSDVAAAIASRPRSVEGVSPTLAEASGDAGLAGFQRGYGNTDMATSSALFDRNAANSLARTDAIIASLRSDSPQALQDYASRSLAEAEGLTAAQRAEREAEIQARLYNGRDQAGRSLTDAERALESGQAGIGPAADRAATGTVARKAYDDAYEAAKGKTREAYSAPVLNTPQPIKIPRPVFMKVREAADDFYGDGGGEMPSKLQSVITDLADPNATTRTLTNIDRRLADFAGEARMGGRASEAAFAERVRATLGDFTMKAAPKPYRDALASAKAIRAEQGRRFETGDIANVFARDRYGAPAVGDTTLPSKLVRPGAAGGDTIDRLIGAVGPETAERTVREELRRSIEEGGINSSTKLATLAARFTEVGKRFPAVAKDLQDLQRYAGELEGARSGFDAAAAAKPTPEEVASLGQLSALHDKILASPLGKLADGAVDPSSYVTSLLRRSDDGRQLRYLASMVKNDPQALGGLRTSLADFIESAGLGQSFTSAGDQIPAINKTRGAIATVMKRAGDILTPQQKMVLQSVKRELERASFAATAAKPPGSETALNRTFDQLLNSAPVPGKAKSMLSVLYSVLGNGQEVKRLLNQAIFDPDFAATLLKRPTAAHWGRVQGNMALKPGKSRLVAPATVGAAGIMDLKKALTDAFSGGAPLRAAADQNPQEPGIVNGSAGQDQSQYEGAQP